MNMIIVSVDLYWNSLLIVEHFLPWWIDKLGPCYKFPFIWFNCIFVRKVMIKNNIREKSPSILHKIWNCKNDSFKARQFLQSYRKCIQTNYFAITIAGHIDQIGHVQLWPHIRCSQMDNAVKLSKPTSKLSSATSSSGRVNTS